MLSTVGSQYPFQSCCKPPVGEILRAAFSMYDCRVRARCAGEAVAPGDVYGRGRFVNLLCRLTSLKCGCPVVHLFKLSDIFPGFSPFSGAIFPHVTMLCFPILPSPVETERPPSSSLVPNEKSLLEQRKRETSRSSSPEAAAQTLPPWTQDKKRPPTYRQPRLVEPSYERLFSKVRQMSS